MPDFSSFQDVPAVSRPDAQLCSACLVLTAGTLVERNLVEKVDDDGT